MGIRVAVVTEDWAAKVITLSNKECGQDSFSISEHIASELADIGLTDELMKIKMLFTTHDSASLHR